MQPVCGCYAEIEELKKQAAACDKVKYNKEIKAKLKQEAERRCVQNSKHSKKVKNDSQKKTARRATSNVFAMFEQNQIAEFKEAFQLIDSNKDGLIDKNDLRATFESLGKIVNENDLNNMLAEAPGPINFTMFLTIFGERISGTDQEEVIKKAFKTFDPDGAGKISEKKLKKALTTWGEKLKDTEVDEAFKEAPMDRDGMIDINSYVKVICGSAVDEE